MDGIWWSFFYACLVHAGSFMSFINRIGKWKVTVVETGTMMLDGGAMMGSVPKVLWEKDNAPDDLNRIQLSMRCLLLDDGENVVLVETGIGNKFTEKFKKMFNIKVDKLGLSNTLSNLGYCHEKITHVILTHLHFDHAGGATVFDENGEIIPSFPNAKYYVSEKNWKAGNNPNPKDKASYLAFGSFAQSKLKPNAKKASLNILKWAKRNIKKPIIAIGGINNSNYRKIIKSGAKYNAISSYIWDNPKLKPEIAIRKFK